MGGRQFRDSKSLPAMSRFTLDYSAPRPQSRNRLRWRRSRLSTAALLGFCLLVNGVVLIGIYLLSRENRQLRQERDTHALRYDSLLATKLHADRLLAEQLRGLSPKKAPAASSSETSND